MSDTCLDEKSLLVPGLLVLIASLLVVTAGLVVGLRRQKSKLRKSHEYLVRYITSNLELKKQVPGLKEPYPFNPPEITPEEFTKIINNMLKRFLFLSLFALLALPLAAQEAASDNAYAFRFVRGDETFYVPFRDNAPTFDRLIRRLDSCRMQLDDGYSYVSVTGYISRGTDQTATRRIGHLRNSYVKSALITRARLAERMFVTDRVTVGATAEGLTDVVVVTFPAPVEKVERIAGAEAAEKVIAYTKQTQRSGGMPETEPAAKPRQSEPEERSPLAGQDTPSVSAEPLPAAEPGPQPAARKQNGVSLRANLLRWATLTPDMGIEWRIDAKWSVQVNGSWTSWSWSGRDRRYALWEVAPEVRRYLGTKQRAYVGVLYKAGGFNCKFSDTGRQGDLTGGGITGGYRLPLGRALALDFSAGIGCIHAEYDTYAVIDGVRMRRGSETKNWWGPVSAGVSLVWTIF